MEAPRYRLELASSARASCKGVCKGTEKIAKGELRFGTWLEGRGGPGGKSFASWQWRHWGCVTPKQISNIIEKVGNADDLDGYEDLDSENQGKVRKALENGHVADADKSEKAAEHDAELADKEKAKEDAKRAKEDEKEEKKRQKEAKKEDNKRVKEEEKQSKAAQKAKEKEQTPSASKKRKVSAHDEDKTVSEIDDDKTEADSKADYDIENFEEESKVSSKAKKHKGANVPKEEVDEHEGASKKASKTKKAKKESTASAEVDTSNLRRGRSRK